MAVDPKRSLSPQDYLALERQLEWKSEYIDGEMVAMTGVSREHSLIVTNLSRELSLQLLGRPCEVHANDLRVRVTATGLYTYPDLVVACGDPVFEEDTLLTPTLIIEVLSPSTEAYDRGKKFESYSALDSLQEYLLVAQDRPRVEQLVRQDDGRWTFSASNDLAAVLVLPSIQCELALAKVYSKVKLG